MKKLALKMSAFALVLLTMFNACKDDDSASCDNGSFDLTVNAEEMSKSSFNNTLVKGNNGSVAGKRMDIRAKDGEGLELIITISDVSTGAIGNGISIDEYISVDEISGGDENTFFFTIIEDNDDVYTYTEGSLDITACDPNEKQVSGTFSFEGEGYEVSGTFTDMCYRIVK
jgi:hypothetical protein